MASRFDIVQMSVILNSLWAIVCRGNQPSYQVALYVHLPSQQAPLHLCNGAIVQSRLILTTATCVHYEFSSSNGRELAIPPNMITISCGASTLFNQELQLQVAEVFVADHFDYTTGENDLALLRLKGILPLDKRHDISWITLEDDGEYDATCLANFYIPNQPKEASDRIQSKYEQLPILDSEECRMMSHHPIERKNDICSLYYPPVDFNCHMAGNIQNYKMLADRGTGLVCGNKLIGLLSTILPRPNITDCRANPTKAYYTAIVPHVAWIFNFITEEDIKMLNEGEYIASSPYDRETDAFVETQSTDRPSSAPANSTALSSQTTESLAQQNAAACVTLNLKLLSSIFGIIYLMYFYPLSH